MRTSWILLILLFWQPTLAADKILNVYNWANYLPNKIIQQFQHETGIHINYLEYDSNNILYAKLKANPDIGFDIIVPSSYYVNRMAAEGMLHKLDLSKIPNRKNINPAFLRRKFDPDNNYSLPYTWGATGIAVNDKYFDPSKLNRWQDLWNKKYKNQLLILNDMRETFSVALITLGYSVNDTNPKHIHQAFEKLRQLLPNIKLFNTEAEQNIYVDEDATLGMGWNGDIFQVQRENKHVHFIYPKGTYVLWIDSIAIPKNAPHLQNAYKFINFLNRPEIAAEIAISNGYSSPNLAAIKRLPKLMRQSLVLNPSPSTLKRSVLETDVGPAIAIYEKYWELLKLGS